MPWSFAALSPVPEGSGSPGKSYLIFKQAPWCGWTYTWTEQDITETTEGGTSLVLFGPTPCPSRLGITQNFPPWEELNPVHVHT